MTVKLVFAGGKINVVSAYAPQVGCAREEKEQLWEEMEEVVREIPSIERVIIRADLNAHVVEDNTGFESLHGGFSCGVRNEEGESALNFVQAVNLALGNTFFKKRKEHYITYKSGQNETTINYIILRRANLKELTNYKVIPVESISRQHRILVANITLALGHSEIRRPRTRKVKWYQLEQEEQRDEFKGDRTIDQMDNRREVTIMGRTAGMLSADRRGSPGTDQRRHVSREGIVVVRGGRP